MPFVWEGGGRGDEELGLFWCLLMTAQQVRQHLLWARLLGAEIEGRELDRIIYIYIYS